MAKAEQIEIVSFKPIKLILETQNEVNLLEHLTCIANPRFNAEQAQARLSDIRILANVGAFHQARKEIYAALRPFLSESLPLI